MTFRGVIKDGVIIVPESVELPNGTEVDVQPRRRRSKVAKATSEVKASTGKAKQRKKKTGKSLSLADRLRPIIGMAKGLPSDFAAQHDHYIHGTPKRR